MPIVYEPPQPFSPAISQGYGAAIQGVQDVPLIQHAQDQQSANRRAELGAAVSNNELAARAGQANADRASAEAARSAGMREQAYQFDESRRPSARDVFGADLQFQQTAQRFALHAAMQQEELSQAERMRLQRLQQAKGTIQQQVNEGYMTPEEGNLLMTQAQTGINPLQQRLAATKVKQEEAETQLLMHKAAQAATIENEHKKWLAKTFNDRVAVWTDPETGKPIHFYEKAPGQWEPVKNPEVAQEKQAKEAERLDTIRLKDYERSVERIQKANEQWADRRDKKEEAAALKAGRQPELMTADQIHQNFLTDMQRAGLEPTWEAQRAKMAGQDAARQPVTVTGSGQIPTTAAAPQRELPPELRKPFDEYDKASKPQKNQLDSFRSQVERIDSLPIPPAAKTAYHKATLVAEGMLREYGDISQAGMARMTEADRAELTRARLVMDQIETMKFNDRQPAPQQRPTAAPSIFQPAPSSSFRPSARRS